MATQVKLNKEQLVADLASEYCQKTQNGEAVEMKDYLRQCPDQSTRKEFKNIVNTHLLLTVARQVPRPSAQ